MRLDEITQSHNANEQAILVEIKNLGLEHISTFNDDGSVNVNGNVNLPYTYSKIPIKFGRVYGAFHCSSNCESLHNAPKYVQYQFICSNTKITSLEGSPLRVDGDFSCANTAIATLQGSPKFVGGAFKCSSTNIRSLEGAPQYVGGDFVCALTKIKSLEGSPEYVGGDFSCRNTKVTSLHGIHKTHTNWVISGTLHLPNNCTHLLGLAYIPGVRSVNLHGRTYEVIHDIFEWQEKLLELGLEEQAQL
jgi:hypothetical protein